MNFDQTEILNILDISLEELVQQETTHNEETKQSENEQLSIIK